MMVYRLFVVGKWAATRHDLELLLGAVAHRDMLLFGLDNDIV